MRGPPCAAKAARLYGGLERNCYIDCAAGAPGAISDLASYEGEALAGASTPALWKPSTARRVGQMLLGI
jgi:hypothetical protein